MAADTRLLSGGPDGGQDRLALRGTGGSARAAVFLFICALLLPSLPGGATGLLLTGGAEGKPASIRESAALVVYRGGVEFCIADPEFTRVELDRPFVWIIPVPAGSTAEAAPPGIVETARILLGPETREVGRHPDDSFIAVWFISLVLLPLAFTATGRILDLEVGRKQAAVIGVATLGGSVLAFTIAQPGLAWLDGKRDLYAPQVSDVRQLHPVRDPIAPEAIMRFRTSGELDRWLSENDFPAAPEEFRARFAMLAEKSWECVTVTGMTGKEGVLHPGPLLIRFATDRAVLPPCLADPANETGGVLVTDITTISETPIQAAAGEIVLREHFVSEGSRISPGGELTPTAASNRYGIMIGRPELGGWIGTGAWVTRALGELRAEDAGVPLVLESAPDMPTRHRVWGITAAVNRAVLPGVWTLVLLPPFLAMLLRGRSYRKRWIWIAALLLAPLVGALRLLSMDVVRLQGPRYRNVVRMSFEAGGDLPVRAVHNLLRLHARDSPLPLESVTTDGIESRLDEIIRARFVNPRTRLPVTESDTPGNYRWVRVEGGESGTRLEMIVYDDSGYPSRHDIEEILKLRVEAVRESTSWRKRR